MKKIAVIPTLFTLGNGVCGFAAITFAARIPRGIGLPLGSEEINWLWWSALMILAAMVLDALDGRVARMARSTSDFGGQLDSLCDAISFGAAPAFLLLKLCSDSTRLEVSDVWIKGLWMIAVLYVVCAVLRLARFNVENDHGVERHLWFKGLPSPAAAGALASTAILRRELREDVWTDILGTVGIDVVYIEQLLDVSLPLGVVALSVLMVSRVPYPHLANQLLRGRHSFTHLVKLIFLVVSVVLMRELALPLLFWSFALGSPLLVLWKTVRQRQVREQPAVVE